MKPILKTVAVAGLLGIAAGCRSIPNARPDAPSGPSAGTAALPADPVHAYLDTMRLELSAGKAGIYQDVMAPTAQEAGIFWPIYAEYEGELFDLGDRRLELMRKFSEAYNAGKLDAAASAKIAAEVLKLQQESLDLLKKYHGIIAKELSPLQAGQFLQIEHRMATVIDLLVAAQIPLLRLEPIEARLPAAKE